MSFTVNVVIYKCSDCNHVSSHRSNMVAHTKRCGNASIEKFDVNITFSGNDFKDPKTKIEPKITPLQRGPFPLRTFTERLLETSVNVEDVKERIEWVYEGGYKRLIRDELLNSKDGITLFHKCLYRIMGYKTPKNLRSVYVIGSKKGKKYLTWKSNGSVKFEELSKASCLAFLREAYQTFYSVFISHALESTDNIVRAEASNMEDMCARVVNMKDPSDKKYNIHDLLHGKKKDKQLLDKLASIEQYLKVQRTTRDILYN